MRTFSSILFRRDGQSVPEAILLLPIFLTVILGLLQIGLIGTAIMTTSYAAGSIVRKAVAGNDYAFSGSAYMDRFAGLLVGGMQAQALSGKASSEGTNLYNMTVNACTKVDALPLVGYFLKPILQGSMEATGTCQDATPAVAFASTPPHYFVIHSMARARMNYKGQ